MLCRGVNLRYPHGTAQAGLYLAEVHDAGDADHLQHAVPVVGLAELVVLLGTPRVRAGAPASKRHNHNMIGDLMLSKQKPR